MKIDFKVVLIFTITSLSMGCSSMKYTVNSIYGDVKTSGSERITSKDMEHLPENVQNYLKFTKIIDKERAATVRLRQSGEFRTSPDQNWKPMKAEQYFNVNNVEFCWRGRTGIITATDKFTGGKGSLTVKLLGFIKVVDAKGSEVDQGEILRFLSEIVWFPSAFLSDNIKWSAVNDNSAKATISFREISDSAIFHFNEKNQIEKITAKRYMESGGKFSLEDWEIGVLDYAEFDGVMIPNRCNVSWKLETGDFCWYKFEIVDIDYNNPTVY